MKYLIASDLHGSRPALLRLLQYYDAVHCDMLLLLGDLLNYGPRNGLPDGLDPMSIVSLLNSRSRDIVCVRGNCDSEVDQMLFDFPMTATYAVVVDDGVRLFLTHGHVYSPDRLPLFYTDLFCQGHTHRWQLQSADGEQPCLLNVGSPTFPKDGNPPTFAIYEKGLVRVLHAETYAVLSECRIGRN